MDPHTKLYATIGAVQIATMSPGPAFTLVTQYSALYNRRMGVIAGVGASVGVSFWAVGAALGAASLSAISASALILVRLLGAMYLGSLGLRSILAARKRYEATFPVGLAISGGALTAFRSGLLGNFLNPACALFFLSMMSTCEGPLLVVGAAIIINIIWFMLVSYAIGSIRRYFLGQVAQRAMALIAGIALLGMAAAALWN